MCLLYPCVLHNIPVAASADRRARNLFLIYLPLFGSYSAPPRKENKDRLAYPMLIIAHATTVRPSLSLSLSLVLSHLITSSDLRDSHIPTSPHLSQAMDHSWHYSSSFLSEYCAPLMTTTWPTARHVVRFVGVFARVCMCGPSNRRRFPMCQHHETAASQFAKSASRSTCCLHAAAAGANGDVFSCAGRPFPTHQDCVTFSTSSTAP